MNSSKSEKMQLWQAAIKWPLYSVAIMPVLLATGWRFGIGEAIRLDQLIGFLVASILLLLWENLTNDLFDDQTGIDKFKLHSVVKLLGNKKLVEYLAYLSLGLALIIIVILASRSSSIVIFLVLSCCVLGYIYQGPPFRLGYQGLGEPLCWIAFGPLATAASLIVIAPLDSYPMNQIPWLTAIELGTGPALATTLVLFCSHFHQVNQDAASGKKSPLVRLGTRTSASLIPWIISITIVVECVPIIQGKWPITALLGIILGLPPAMNLIHLLNKHHNEPALIRNSKFLALKFQALNGLGLSFGLALASFPWLNSIYKIYL